MTKATTQNSALAGRDQDAWRPGRESGVMKTCVLCSVVALLDLATTQVLAEQPPVNRETEKAARVSRILKKHPLQLVRGSSYGSHSTEFCNTFLEALKNADKEIAYIEPVLRTDDPDAPGLRRYRSSCGRAGGVGLTTYNDDIRVLGDHRFRLYRLKVERGKRVKSVEWIYAEKKFGQEDSIAQVSGYMEVDFDRCEWGPVLPVTPDIYGENIQADNYNALIRYRGGVYAYRIEGYPFGWKPGQPLRTGNSMYLHAQSSAPQSLPFPLACKWLSPETQ